TFSFLRKDIRLIRVHAGNGDDLIRASSANDPMDIRMSVDGGAGNDVITGGAADDTLVGNTGSDTITGGGGIDFIDYRYVDAPEKLISNPRLFGLYAVMGQDTVMGSAKEPGGSTDMIDFDIEGIIGTAFADQI